MPELPEVETVRRVLEPRLAGRRIGKVRVPPVSFHRRPDARALRALRGGRIEGLSRRGKYLILRLKGRPGVILHLGMSGRLVLNRCGPHCRLCLEADGLGLHFHDARRFGRVGGPLPELGPEPLDPGFDAQRLAGVLRGRRAPVKALLMDQRLVSGLGNIYATEALHRAGIRPSRPGGRVTRREAAALAKACREVLRRGVARGGATLADESFLDPLGRPGRMGREVRIYGRRACGICGGPAAGMRLLIQGRSSRYCPSCQR